MQRNGRTFEQFLSFFETVTTGAGRCVVRARIPNVDFTKRTIIARAVILTFRYATTDTSVYFLSVFIHHNKKPPFLVTTVCANFQKIIDFFEKLLYNSIESKKQRGFFRAKEGLYESFIDRRRERHG